MDELEFEVEEVRCDSCEYLFPSPGFVNEGFLREELTHVCGGGVRGTYALEHLGDLGYIPPESYERPITAHESIMIAEAAAWRFAGRYFAAIDAETIRGLAGA